MQRSTIIFIISWNINVHFLKFFIHEKARFVFVNCRWSRVLQTNVFSISSDTADAVKLSCNHSIDPPHEIFTLLHLHQHEGHFPSLCCYWILSSLYRARNVWFLASILPKIKNNIVCTITIAECQRIILRVWLTENFRQINTTSVSLSFWHWGMLESHQSHKSACFWYKHHIPEIEKWEGDADREWPRSLPRRLRFHLIE